MARTSNVKSDLFSHEGLLDGGKVFKWRKQNVSMIGTSHILDESAELVTECRENFVLILDRLCILLVWQPRVKAVHERTIQERN